MDLYTFLLIPICVAIVYRVVAQSIAQSSHTFFQRFDEVLFAALQCGLLIATGFFNPFNLAVFVILGSSVFLGLRGRHLVALLGLSIYCSIWIDIRYIAPVFGSGWASSFNTVISNLIDPRYVIGTSYLAFKLISAYVDRESLSSRNPTLFSFLAWLFFFPSIVSGPIHLFDDWCEKRGRQHFNLELALDSGTRIVSGFLKNVVASQLIFDLTASKFTDGAISYLSYAEIFSGMAFYAVYIFLNFSGFSDLAIGTGLLWGVRLPENFNRPFLKRNLQEFWMAWHMSLLNWLRRYLFLPLLFNLSKKPWLIGLHRDLPTIISLWVLFLAVALWHAWTINYLFWGVSNAIGLTLLHLLKTRLNWKRPMLKRWKESTAASFVSTVLTLFFTIVTFGVLALSPQQFGLLIERVQISLGLIRCEMPEVYLQHSSDKSVTGRDARCIYYKYSPTLLRDSK